MKFRTSFLLGLLFASAPVVGNAGGVNWVGTDFSGKKCDGPGNRGRDYSDPRPGPQGREFLPVVEKKHFGPAITGLDIQGRGPYGAMKGTKDIAFELNYVLGQFPNHYRALELLSRFPAKIARRVESDASVAWSQLDDNTVYAAVIMLSENYNVPRYECYLTRAINWQPENPVLHILYGIYAHKTGRFDIAAEEYGEAIRLNPGYADAHYNLGLLLFEQGDYAEARKSAEHAYKLGYTLPALRRKLAEVDFPLD